MGGVDGRIARVICSWEHVRRRVCERSQASWGGRTLGVSQTAERHGVREVRDSGKGGANWIGPKNTQMRGPSTLGTAGWAPPRGRSYFQVQQLPRLHGQAQFEDEDSRASASASEVEVEVAQPDAMCQCWRRRRRRRRGTRTGSC